MEWSQNDEYLKIKWKHICKKEVVEEMKWNEMK